MDVNDPPVRSLQELAGGTLDLSAFDSVVERTLKLGRKEVIRAQGEPVNEVYFLSEGWVAGSMSVMSGRRQIVKINLPGDVLGVPSLCLANAALTLETLTPAVLQVIPIEDFARLFKAFPKLALSLFLTTQQERVMLMERLASVGQTKAIQRVCAFLLHIHQRLVGTGGAHGQSFELPLTQAELAEIVGVTFVHVNRSLRELDRRDLIERVGKRITLVDLRALRELADLPERAFVSDPQWLNCDELGIRRE